jgi:hypothetical protein
MQEWIESRSVQPLLRPRRRCHKPEKAFAMLFLRKVTQAPAVMSRGVSTCESKPTVFGSAYP